MLDYSESLEKFVEISPKSGLSGSEVEAAESARGNCPFGTEMTGREYQENSLSLHVRLAYHQLRKIIADKLDALS